MAKLTPGKVIRLMCIDCVGGVGQPKDCQGDTLVDGPCLFYPHRTGRGRPKLRVIRKNCLFCMGGSSNLVRDCKSATCKAHSYRFGKRPEGGEMPRLRGFSKPESTIGKKSMSAASEAAKIKN